MGFSEYLLNSNEFALYNHNNQIMNFITEINQPMLQQQMDPQLNVNPTLEFESIKLYILYSRFKELRQYVQNINIKAQNNDLDSIIEFLDIILLFYSTFTYSDLTTFLDSVTSSLEEKLKLKLPKRVYSDPAIDGGGIN